MIAHRYAELSQVRMHYLEAGGGSDVVLLLYGWPHTSLAWRHVIPNLVGRDVGGRTDLMKEALADSRALEVHSRNVHAS
jgi:pimeloyl-ACP methyl ester carboxylesterase